MTKEQVVAMLRKRFRAHTVLLYGSRARGEAGPSSDWDLLALRDGAPVRVVQRWRGAQLDVFVKSTRWLRGPLEPGELRLLGAEVLLDERGEAKRLLRRVAALKRRKPKRLPPDERRALRAWAWKTLDRAAEPTAYGRWRRAELLTLLVSDYFALRGRAYPGPKRALTTLPPKLAKAYARALKPAAGNAGLEPLVRLVAGPRR